MSKYTWHQNGPGSKSLGIGRFAQCERACPPKHYADLERPFKCYPDVFYAVRPIPAHRRWQYEANEKYEIEYAERHLEGRWIETIGHAPTQSEGKAIAEKHMEGLPS